MFETFNESKAKLNEWESRPTKHNWWGGEKDIKTMKGSPSTSNVNIFKWPVEPI